MIARVEVPITIAVVEVPITIFFCLFVKVNREHCSTCKKQRVEIAFSLISVPSLASFTEKMRKRLSYSRHWFLFPASIWYIATGSGPVYASRCFGLLTLGRGGSHNTIFADFRFWEEICQGWFVVLRLRAVLVKRLLLQFGLLMAELRRACSLTPEEACAFHSRRVFIGRRASGHVEVELAFSPTVSLGLGAQLL
ncbi:hypothetical protein IGI04_038006 [Brassica rapa subsp. trilocularis]|uniref:Uncharacterized protein n=1 Tax=Brassica rapa subsp. trilocularis TaxID=1813537 RepID=A0ABQ7LIZ6_BRACM|nr:hypothetical protein IGI04_038006 [Brassica rapa subsp. trilocularis]